MSLNINRSCFACLLPNNLVYIQLIYYNILFKYISNILHLNIIKLQVYYFYFEL